MGALRSTLSTWVREPAYRFALAVIAAGCAVVAWLGAAGHFDGLALPGLELLVLAGLTLGGEAVVLRLPRQHDDSQLSASTLFAFAILLAYGVGPAVTAFAGAVLLVDLVRRRAPIKIAFNTAQYALAMAAGGAVLAASTGLPAPEGQAPFAIGDAPGIGLAALTVFTVNHLLTAIVTALAMGSSLRSELNHDGNLLLSTDALQILFAPVVVVVADYGVALLPMLGLPVAALFLSAQEADRRKHASLHDPLTGLPNRASFAEQSARALSLDEQAERRVAMLLLDINHFKEINDTLGHGHGDAVLIAVAGRLAALARPGDMVARLGGDEFGILVPDAGSDAALLEQAGAVVDVLAAPVEVADLRLVAGASVGIATSVPSGDTPDALLRRADVAMYTAKAQGTGIAWYDRARDPHDAARLRLVSELREGIPRGELVLHYQPKLSLCTGRVTGVEALVRWQHPQRGLLFPGEFIELAENNDLIGPLTLSVLETALADTAAWARRGVDLTVAVNLAAQTLLDQRLPATIAAKLEAHGLEGRHLVLEITERMLMHDPDRSAEILHTLSATGVQVSVDDFGTGYSSLALLQRLPVDEIKVDRSFVGQLTEKPSDAAIVRSTIGLGQTLGLRVVAEGVEDAGALAELAGWGCHQAQGYLVSRPVPSDALIAWLDGLEVPLRFEVDPSAADAAAPASVTLAAR